jgi:hypothetical protein
MLDLADEVISGNIDHIIGIGRNSPRLRFWVDNPPVVTSERYLGREIFVEVLNNRPNTPLIT